MKKVNFGQYITGTPKVRIKRLGNQLAVNPRIIVAVPGKTIEIINTTDDTVCAQIRNVTMTFKIAPQSTYFLKVPKVRPGAYPFSLFSLNSCFFCWAPPICLSSLPIIIVPKL